MLVTIKNLGGGLAVIIPGGVARKSKLVEGATLDISGGVDAVIDPMT